MALSYNGTIIGKIVIKQGENKFPLQIRQGNCLAVIINVGKADEEKLKEHPDSKYIHTLYTFYADEQHLKNMMKMSLNVSVAKSSIKCHIVFGARMKIVFGTMKSKVIGSRNAPLIKQKDYDIR